MTVGSYLARDGNGTAEGNPGRRALLRKAALAGGALWLAAGIRAQPALAHTNVFDGYIDVTSDGYGADATGATNAAPVINQAITDASNSTPKPKSVYIPPGTYRIDQRLELPSNARLIGHPRHSVIVTGSWFPGAMIRNTNQAPVHDVCIDGLSLDGGGKAATAVNFSNLCTRITIRNVEVHNGRPRYDQFIDIDGDGIYGEAGPPAENGSSHALRFEVEHGSIENCEVHDWGRDGISLTNSRNVLVRRNIVRNCNDDHIAAHGDRLMIVGNIIFARRTGWGGTIAARSSKRVKIVGNLLYGSVRGVEITGVDDPNDSGRSSQIDVSCNTIVETGNVDAPFGTPGAPDVCRDDPGTSGPDCPGWGASNGSAINVMSAVSNPLRNIKITGNVISAPRNHGIQILRGSTNSVIRDVLISGNQIFLDQTAAYLEGNLGSGIACVYTAGGTDAGVTDGVRIRGNDIRGALGPGIKVTGGNHTRFEIQDNRVLDSGRSSSKQPGIMVDGVDGVLIANNRAQDTRTVVADRTQQYGLSLFNPRDSTSVLGNVFTGNALTGSGNDTVVNLSGSTQASRLRIRDNMGFNPWVGSVTLSGALSQGPVQIGEFRYWWKEVQVIFGEASGSIVPFPKDTTPQVLVTTNQAAYTAVAFDVNRGSFKCRVFAAANNADTPAPSQSEDVTVYWRAEPVD